MKKNCEYCKKETEWEVVHEEKELKIIRCKECNRVEHVYCEEDEGSENK